MVDASNFCEPELPSQKSIKRCRILRFKLESISKRDLHIKRRGSVSMANT